MAKAWMVITNDVSTISPRDVNPFFVTDHDRIHKELLGRLLPDFILAFAPEIAEKIDLGTLTLLQQSFADPDEGAQREVDVLARFELLELPPDGEDVSHYIYFHIEQQGRPELVFPTRMLEYFMKVWLSGERAVVIPIALFTHDAPRKEVNHVELKAFGRDILRFEFQAIQLCRFNWREYADSRNPAIIALLANMGRRQEDRVERKFTAYSLVNQLFKEGHRGDELHLVLSYIDTYLDLDSVETLQFEDQTSTFIENNEPIMEFLTTREKNALKKGRQEGRQEGREKGLEEGQLKMIMIFLDQQEVRLSKSQLDLLASLSDAQFEAAARILSTTPDSFVTWLGELGNSSD